MEFVRLWTILILVLPTHTLGIRRYSTDLQENEFCGYDTSVYSGKCKKIKKCVNLLVERKSIEVCSFDAKDQEETLVCCSRDDFYKSRTHNREGPLDFNTCVAKYEHLRRENEEVSQFVVNGVEVQDAEFPHMAAIGWLRWMDFSVDWNCGGSLITENFILTAAHCTVYDGRQPNVVRVGDVDLKSEDDDTYVQQFGVLRTVRHPLYQFSTHEDDIGLIQFVGFIFPTTHVVPACLYPGSVPTEYFEAAGYGQDGDGMLTNKLLKVFLKNVNIDKCQESYESMTLSSDSQICAQNYRDDLDVQDTCYGDSGSPLQYISSNSTIDGKIFKTPIVVGITSFGIGCAYGHASVYVKVSNYLSWMESVIMP